MLIGHSKARMKNFVRRFERRATDRVGICAGSDVVHCSELHGIGRAVVQASNDDRAGGLRWVEGDIGSTI